MDVEKSLTLMSKLTTDQTLERIQAHVGQDEVGAGERLEKYNEQINEFKGGAKKMFSMLMKFKNYVGALQTLRKHETHQMKKFSGFFADYETNSLGAYSASKYQASMFFSDPNLATSKEKVDSIGNSRTNPFVKMRYWVKEEQLDLASILEAIHVKEGMEKRLEATKKKKRSTQNSLDKLSQGKKTLTNFWKSQSTKANNITQYTATIAQCEQDIENYERMIKMAACNLSENSIPQFKQDKSVSYYRMLTAFSSAELKNSQDAADVWSHISDGVKSKA